nr:hypothetical protein [Rhodococcus sp. (in: high G+C Gram-positive bacteria)]
MTTTVPRSSSQLIGTLRTLYFARFAFAAAWAAILVATKPQLGALLTFLVVVYPLVDAAAVSWQLRIDGSAGAPRTTERINVVVSVVVAIALGWASTYSLAAALGIWGVWAAASGLTQLVTAVKRRSAGGQIPQMLSGGISIAAGLAFATQALQGSDSIDSVGGYALLGGVFFLVSAVRLSLSPRSAL